MKLVALLAALKKGLADNLARTDAALYQRMWGGGAAIVCVIVGICVGSFWPWYYVASLLAILLLPSFVFIGRSTWPKVQNRRSRSGNKFMALHDQSDQFIADIVIIRNLPLSDSEKAPLYLATYQAFLRERKQLRASMNTHRRLRSLTDRRRDSRNT